jgi:hypothetical protein
MDRKKLFKNLAFLIFLIFFADFIAHKLYWYSSVWYFDMLMHFFGGLWLGLFLIWFFYADFSPTLRKFLKIIIGVLLIGILWEVFEILVNQVAAQNSLNFLDIVSDLFFDLAGGIFALFYFIKKDRQTGESNIQLSA